LKLSGGKIVELSLTSELAFETATALFSHLAMDCFPFPILQSCFRLSSLP
jgi:hypothetical protein